MKTGTVSVLAFAGAAFSFAAAGAGAQENMAALCLGIVGGALGVIVGAVTWKRGAHA